MARSVVVQGSIEPIKARRINFNKLIGNTFESEEDEVEIEIPVHILGIHEPQLESLNPLVVGQITLDHALICAKRLISRMATLPHNEQAGDLLAMAYAILHYAGEKERL